VRSSDRLRRLFAPAASTVPRRSARGAVRSEREMESSPATVMKITAAMVML
jgi:hypothetical protein